MTQLGLDGATLISVSCLGFQIIDFRSTGKTVFDEAGFPVFKNNNNFINCSFSNYEH